MREKKKFEFSIRGKMAELFTIVWCHNNEALADRIAHNADLNIQDGSGNTLLIKAVIHDFDDTAQMLVNAGCDMDMQDMFGNTALLVAAQKHNEKMVRWLIKAGADVNVCNKRFETLNDFIKEEETIQLLNQIRHSKKERQVKEGKETA